MKSGLLPTHTARSQNSKLSSELNPKLDQAACARCLSLSLCAAAGCCRAAPPSPPTCSQRMRAGWRRKVPRATPARDGRRICYLYGHQRAGHHVAIARLPTTPCPRVPTSRVLAAGSPTLPGLSAIGLCIYLHESNFVPTNAVFQVQIHPGNTSETPS